MELSDLTGKGTVVFLASAASDYLTGVTIPVDGGFLGR
jgi:2-deoxy-D-gluconate 3-dehydrogenase